MRALGVRAPAGAAGAEELAGMYRTVLNGRRVLIVLDNARDAGQVRPLLPGGRGNLTVVTSRNTLAGVVASTGAALLEIRPLDPADARALLSARLGPARTGAEPEATAAIAGACGGLPLALAVVAARGVTRPASSLAAVDRRLTDPRRRLDEFATLDAQTDFRAVFSWSYRTLGPAAARLFRLLGRAPGATFPADTVAGLAGVARSAVMPLLDELVAAHLVAPAADGRYAMHDLVHAYAAELTHRGVEREETCELHTVCGAKAMSSSCPRH